MVPAGAEPSWLTTVLVAPKKAQFLNSTDAGYFRRMALVEAVLSEGTTKVLLTAVRDVPAK